MQMLKNRRSYKWHNSTLMTFFRWWHQELVACLPQRFKKALQSSNTEQLHYWSPGALLSAPPAQEKQRRQILILPRDHILLVTVQLPAAAYADVDSALFYEIDKYTPFKTSDLYFDKIGTLGMNHDAGQINFRVAVILRERLNTLLDGLNFNECCIYSVDALDDQGNRLNINLLPVHRRPSHSNPRRRLQQVLTSVSLIMLIAVMLLWVQNRQSALDQMTAQVTALRTDSQQVQALQQQLKAIMGAGRFVADRKSQTASKIALLRELTICIPSDTWLEQLDINQQGTVRLSGQSRQASELIERMKTCTSLESLQFQGIIQPDSNTRMDRFILTAQLRIKDDNHESDSDGP